MTYLFLRKSIFYFRARIPTNLVATIGRKEICLSLKTRDKRVALLRCGRYLEAFHQTMSKLTFDLSLFIKQTDGKEIRADFDPTNPVEIELFKKMSGLHTNASPSSIPPLTELQNQYLQHLKTERKFAAIDSCKRTFELWEQRLGTIAPDQLTQGKLSTFKRELETVIARGKTVALSPKTIGSHVKNMVAFSYWASTNYDGFKALTSRGVAPKRRVRAHEERQRFSNDQIASLFGERFDSLKPEQQWLMRLGALTGARIKELCQISLREDVRVTDNGVHFLSINDDDEEKALKTISGKRVVPLHPKLLELGVLQFFENQKKAGYTRPFESLWTKWREDWGKYPGKWFSSYKAEIFCEIDHSKLVFHSFRHTLADELKKAGIDEVKAQAIMGHSDSSITYNRYAKPFSPDDLASTIANIDSTYIK